MLLSILKLTLLGALLIFSISAKSEVDTAPCKLTSWAELDQDYWTALNNLAIDPCSQAENNKSELGIRVSTQLKDLEMDSRSKALLVLDEIQFYLEKTFNDENFPQSDNATALLQALSWLRLSIENNLQKPEKDILKKWKLGKLDMMPEMLEQLDFSTRFQSADCEKVKSGNCDADFKRAVDIIKAIHLMNSAIHTYANDFRKKVYLDRKLRRRKWDSYYDDLTFQYPWELLVNGWLLECTDNRGIVDGNRVGFRSLPRNKLVLVHPEANLIYAEKANDEYDLSLTVEVLGYESFGYDNIGNVSKPWGGSLLAAYLPRPQSNSFGWTGGLLFKYDGYSLGITDNHGETGIVLNINLSQRIFNVKQDARKYYDDYEKKVEAIRTRLK